MAYRELSRMEIVDLIRRWQAGETQRAIASHSGIARATVGKYLQAAQRLGLSAAGPPPGEAELLELARLSRVAATRPGRATPAVEPLAAHREQLEVWLRQEHLQLTRVQELLARDGLGVSYTSLRRYVRQAGLGQAPRSTVRLPETAPGELAEFDFGRLGTLVDLATGKRRTVWALVVVLVCSWCSFVWPLPQQTLEAVIEGLEASWRFFGGIPKRLILSSFR